MRSPCLLPCLAIVLLSTADAHADEPRPESSPVAPAPPRTEPLPNQVIDAWEASIKEAELRGRYEQTVFNNELARKRFESERAPREEPSPRGIEQRRFLWPDLMSGMYVIGAGALGGIAGPISISNVSAPDQSATHLGVHLAGDLVSNKRWTYGAGLDVGRTYWKSADRTERDDVSVGVKARVGMLFPLGHGVSVWPRIGLGVTRARSESTVGGAPAQPTESVAKTTTIAPQASVALVMPLSRFVFFRVEQSVAYANTSDDDKDETVDVVDVVSVAGLGLSF